MRNNSCGGGAGTSSCEAMRRGVRASVGFARRRNGAVRLLPQRKRVGGESPTLKKSNKFFVGLWLLFVWSHVASQKRKIPVATIGRSLSGGVTGGMIPNILPWCKGANWQRKETTGSICTATPRLPRGVCRSGGAYRIMTRSLRLPSGLLDMT